MRQSDPIFWNEHGELVERMLSCNDASIEDIPRVMREHRDLRKSLHSAVQLLHQLGYEPAGGRPARDWERMNEICRQLPL